MKILITGANGMVGRHLSPKIQALYAGVLTPSSKELDLTKQEAVGVYLAAHQPTCIIHLAAKVGGIQANISDPAGFMAQNSQMALNLITSAARQKIPYFLNFGTSCMYPRGRELLKEEDLLTGALEPTNEGYALAKILATKLCECISMQYGLCYRTIIPSNLYGPCDNFSPDKSHLIAAVIRKIHLAKEQNKQEVLIWGDGSARREFLYVDDLVDFITLAMGQIEALPSWVNVGLGHDYTVLEYYQAVAKVLDYQGEFTFDLTKPVGMRRKLLAIDKACALGWKPATPLIKGIRKTYDFLLDEMALLD